MQQTEFRKALHELVTDLPSNEVSQYGLDESSLIGDFDDLVTHFTKKLKITTAKELRQSLTRDDVACTVRTKSTEKYYVKTIRMKWW